MDEKTKPRTVEVCNAKKIVALAEKAEKGDTEALSALRKEMDMDSIIWETLGNTREAYQERLIESIAGHILEKESIKRWMDAEAEALAGENATPIERLLALRVTLDGVYLNKVETAVLNGLSTLFCKIANKVLILLDLKMDIQLKMALFVFVRPWVHRTAYPRKMGLSEGLLSESSPHPTFCPSRPYS